MVDDLARKFRILADVIQTVNSGRSNTDEIKDALSNMDLKTTEIESVFRMAKEFGFINENSQGQSKATTQGLSFERYVTALNSLAVEPEFDLPSIDRGAELRVCLTVPPMWSEKVTEQFEGLIEDTLLAEKLVAEDTENSLVIVTPYLDIEIMQIILKDVHAKNADLIIMTSEPDLVKYPGTNFFLQKIEGLIKSRFKSGRVLFLSHNTSIVHAKIWCSDRSILVTSANVKADSTTENLEAGIYTNDPELVSTMRSFLRQIPEMEGIRCLLKIPP